MPSSRLIYIGSTAERVTRTLTPRAATRTDKLNVKTGVLVPGGGFTGGILIAPMLARDKMLKHWLSQGNNISQLGMPLHRDLPVYRRGDHFLMDFGGATLSTHSDGSGGVDTSLTRRVRVTFQGFGLDTKQENNGDEIYGVLTTVLGNLGHTKQTDLSQATLAAKDDDGKKRNRISQQSILLHEGAPMDLNVNVAFVEYDHGDRNKVRTAIKTALSDLVAEASNLASAAAGAPTKAAQNKFDAQSLASSNLYKWALTGASALITEIFGLGDDPYNPGAFTISAAEMSRIPPVQNYRCGDDPRTIQYTHRISVSGTDDGGDTGWITALFLVTAA